MIFVLLNNATAQNNGQFKNRLDPNPALAPFYHGVASGDPLSDRVILWTRVTTEEVGDIEINWEIATDTTFTEIVNSGTTTTNVTKDFTVKVDADGLAANTWYYYRFEALGETSIIGRTKTTPDGPASNIRIAVVSCSNYEAGYFNAYQQIAERNDVDAVVHLGDYIYEYGNGQYGDTRLHLPETEILSIDDYRIRHSHYKLDPNLRFIHQQFPFITTWDDHESANDAWFGGAQNHSDESEGNWFDRKSVAIQAYFEWMPLRQPDPSDDERIYRSFSYGDLADIIVLDTRLEGREQQTDTGADPIVNDSSRTLLGSEQFSWLTQQLSNSTAQWKIIAQQVMMAPLGLGTGFGLNPDQWDGYIAERTRLYDHIIDNEIENVVVLTGDIHSSWASNLPYDPLTYNNETGEGSVAVEFVTTSVTSPGFPVPLDTEVIKTLNPHIQYVDLMQKGFYILDLNTERSQADWYYVPTVIEPNYNSSFNAAYFVNTGERLLNENTEASVSANPQQPLAPVVDTEIVGIADAPKSTLLLGSYPNPFINEFWVQYYNYKAQKNTLNLFNIQGQLVYSQSIETQTEGLHYQHIMVPAGLSKGTYIIEIINESSAVRLQTIKAQ